MSKRQTLLRDQRGLSQVEYTVILALVTIGGAVLVWQMGEPLIERFRFMQAVVGLPIP